jgi:hypothetical protein
MMVVCQRCHNDAGDSYLVVPMYDSSRVRWLCHDCIKHVVNEWYMLMESYGDKFTTMSCSLSASACGCNHNCNRCKTTTAPDSDAATTSASSTVVANNDNDTYPKYYPALHPKDYPSWVKYRKLFDDLDEVIYKHVDEYGVTWLEIFLGLNMLTMKLLDHYIRDTVARYFGPAMLKSIEDLDIMQRDINSNNNNKEGKEKKKEKEEKDWLCYG